MICTQSAALVASGLLFLVPCGGQAPESPSAYEALANQMKDLRGESKELWLLDQHGAVLRNPALTRERPESPIAGTVSVAGLRHEVPKAARKAFERGLKDSAKGNHVATVKELEQAVALDPEFADAHNRLGVEYDQMGRPEEAAFGGPDGDLRPRANAEARHDVPHVDIDGELRQDQLRGDLPCRQAAAKFGLRRLRGAR